MLMIPVWFDIHICLGYTNWIDPCQSDGNLLAAGGQDKTIKIFDKRESKIVQTFDDFHAGDHMSNIFFLINYFWLLITAI